TTDSFPQLRIDFPAKSEGCTGHFLYSLLQIAIRRYPTLTGRNPLIAPQGNMIQKLAFPPSSVSLYIYLKYGHAAEL
ncbi:hypothetical protein E2320_000393, partial [Naja naja]